MRKYNCIQNALTAARCRKNGEIGEKLAEQVLEMNGFTDIENLNNSRANHKYADIYAEKDGERYVISVKTRNKSTASGKINPSYNLIKGGDLDFAKDAEETKSAKEAWVTIVLEDTTFDAYFGLLSSLFNRRSIPMTPKATKNYLCLAEKKLHAENSQEFKNDYKRRSTQRNGISITVATQTDDLIQMKEHTMNTSNSETTAQWAVQWLDGVADGSNTMSQRKLSSIETRGGGLDAVKALAEQRGVHLLLLEDDKGDELVAASTKPFSVVC